MTQIRHNYDYGSTYRQALRINWQIKDILGGDKILDFQKPFLPETWMVVVAQPGVKLTDFWRAAMLVLGHGEGSTQYQYTQNP